MCRCICLPAYMSISIATIGIAPDASARQACYMKAVELDVNYVSAWYNLGEAGGGTVNRKKHSSQASGWGCESLWLLALRGAAWILSLLLRFAQSQLLPGIRKPTTPRI